MVVASDSFHLSYEERADIPANGVGRNVARPQLATLRNDGSDPDDLIRIDRG